MSREAAERRAAEAEAVSQRVQNDRLPGKPARITAGQAVSDPILWLQVGSVGFQNGGTVPPGSLVEMLRETVDGGGARRAVVRMTDGRIGWLPLERVEMIEVSSSRNPP